MNQCKSISLPTLSPSYRFVLRIDSSVPTPSPTPSPIPVEDIDSDISLVPSSPDDRPLTTILIDLISPRQHRVLLTAAGEMPQTCPLNPVNNGSPESLSALPYYCSQPYNDVRTFLTRSSRAFLYVLQLPADFPVIITVTKQLSISIYQFISII